MHKIFIHCILFKYIPDLSKCTTENVEYISYLFGECYRLILIPDSSWKASKMKAISGIFLQ